MLYLIWTVIFLIILGLSIQIFGWKGSPFFKLGTAISGENVKSIIRDLAATHSQRKIKDRIVRLDISLICSKINTAYRVLRKKSNKGLALLDFENWFYDNHYLLSSVSSEVERWLQKIGYLPHIKHHPRLYLFINSIIKSTDGFIDKEDLRQYIEIYQKDNPLKHNECKSINNMLKFCLLEYAAIIAGRIIIINKKIERALSKRYLKNIKDDIRFNSYLYGINLSGDNDKISIITKLIENNGVSLDQRLSSFYNQTVRYNAIISNTIKSLRKVDEYIDTQFSLSINKLNKIYEKENCGIYNKMSLDSKEYYLDKTYSLAQKNNKNEHELGRHLLALSNYDNSHVGEHLFGYGKKKDFINKRINTKKLAFYIFFTLLICIFSAYLTIYFAKYNYVIIISVIIALPIYFYFSKWIVDIIIGQALKPSVLPRLDFSKGIPKEHSTVVCMPLLISNNNELDSAVQKLKKLRAVNNHENITYVLLIDFPPAKTPITQTEEGMLSYAKQKYEKELSGDPYVLLWRSRTYCKTENSFLGWERKRGALLQFNKLLLGEDSFENNFKLYLGVLPQNIKYVISLDADTFTFDILRAIETAAHPLNNKYAVFTFRIKTNPLTTAQNAFTFSLENNSGYDIYTPAIFNLGQDFLGEGQYCGKALYSLKAFQRSLEGVLPCDIILSHDLIEGAIAGTADTRNVAYESNPNDMYSYTNRELRWVRGDWQLLAFFRSKVKNEKNVKIKNPCNFLAKWRLFVNIFYSLISISLLLLVTASIFLGCIPLIIAGSYYGLCLLFSLIASIRQMFYIGFSNGVLGGFYSSLLKTLFFSISLPYRAILHFIAITKTLFRLGITKKNLLSWNTFSQTQSQNRRILSFWIKEYRYNYAYALMLVILGYLCQSIFNLTPYSLWLSVGLASYFLLAPIVIYISVKEKSQDYYVEKYKSQLKYIFSVGYKYFSDLPSIDTNYLICDNYQEDFGVGMVNRTSPTNIGFQLLADISAYDMQLIDYQAMYIRILRTIGTLSKLEKWKGNFYNWYDTITLKTLTPKYVSTVDNGNLLCALIICLSVLRNKDKLYNKIKRLINNMNLGELYDYKTNLFYVGTDTKNFYDVHYDLMASEATLTSYIAVALGKVPLIHWKHLSRAAVKYRGNLLYSWSGGMFEYLMSSLFLKIKKGSLLYQTNKNTVNSQIHYAATCESQIWGISESQYNALDNNKLYQYKAFGVPYICLKNPENEPIAYSPYSSILALRYAPARVIRNLNRIIAIGGMGEMGFYESIMGQNYNVLHSYMAHHNGMSLCAINNFLNNDILIERLFSYEDIDAFELLLHEPQIIKARKKRIISAPKPLQTEITQTVYSGNLAGRVYNLLSNGRYSLAIDNKGRGSAFIDNIAITKPYEDNANGVSVYIDGKVINVAKQSYQAVLNSVYSSYIYKKKEYELEYKIALMQEYNGEVRTLTIRNNKKEDITLRVAFYCEPVLTYARNYYSHPVFNNMFVSAHRTDDNIIYACRPDIKNGVYLGAALNEEGYLCTSKYDFYGEDGTNWTRYNSTCQEGYVLEPILAAIKDVTVKSGAQITLSYVIAVSKRLENLREILQRYLNKQGMQRAIDMSATYYRQSWVSFSPDNLTNRAIAYMFSCLRDKITNFDSDNFSAKEKIQIMQKLNIAPERPIITFFLKEEISGELAKMMEIFKYISQFGLEATLVVLFLQPNMYYNSMLNTIYHNLDRFSLRDYHYNGRISIVNLSDTEHDINEILKEFSAFYFDGKFELRPFYNYYSNPTQRKSLPYKSVKLNSPKLQLQCGIGGFTDNGGYYIDLSKNYTPLPWSNIISNGKIGALMTAGGGGYSWIDNSRESKLTDWKNDIICDTPSENIYLYDEDTRISWSLFRLKGKDTGTYAVTHNLGESIYECGYNGIYAKANKFADTKNNAVITKITLTNKTEKTRKISIVLSWDLVLGDSIGTRGDKIQVYYKDGALYAYNPIRDIEVCLSADKNFVYTFSKYDIDNYLQNGKWEVIALGGLCFGICFNLRLKSDETEQVIIALGADKYKNFDNVDRLSKDICSYFQNLSPIKIETPSKELDYMVNYRLPYQVLCSRFLGRCGYYQAGGAWGFRDQLQDCLALLHFEPDMVREHILRCCEHQYEEGDVQHWWHPERTGTRTKITDDLLYLTWVVAEYVLVTGDYSILDEVTPYLKSHELNENEKSRYETPQVSMYADTVYMHCIKTLELAISRRSNRGLSLIGGGDWNDSFDEVGINGEGESIWLSMFLYFCLKTFLPLVRSSELSTEFKNEMISLKKAIESYGWDGQWYRRAYFDDGSPLGSRESKECKIDILSQAWAIISEAAQLERANIAMAMAERSLVDYNYKLVKLFTPPIKELKAGYVKDYPLGIRENGGQYTHAALWYTLACFRQGNKDKAYKILEMLLPPVHCDSLESIKIYKGEPYAVAADIYTNPKFYGQAGWTQYTGAASWMYKIAIENLIGIKKRGKKLIIEPNLPSHWKECTVSYRYNNTDIKIKIISKGGEYSLTIDGRKYFNINYVTLSDSLYKSDIIVEV